MPRVHNVYIDYVVSQIIFSCQAIRVFFHLRDLSLTLKQETEHHLPLTKQEECVNVGDILDLSK